MKIKLDILYFGILLASFFFFSKYYANSDSVNFTSTNEKKTYITERLTSEKPNIDGKFDDECWQGGNWAGNFIQWIPNEGAQPSQETQIKILYDDKSIYVAIRAFDKEPSKISRRSGRRDEFHGDIVGISFDSYHDHRTAFEFDLTAGGQKIDLLLYNPTNWDVNWNAVWKGEVGFEDSAWTAEFEIPFSQLRFSTELEQIWGMHCWRWIDRFQEESDWEPQTSKSAGIIYQFGELHGLYNLINKPPIELMPYILGELNTFKKDLNNPFKKNGREFLDRYPGDEYVDLIGMDNYWDFTLEGEGLEAITKKLKIISQIAKKKNKIAAFTETGLEKIPDTNWWTEKLFNVMNNDSVQIAFVMVWRNAHINHFYAPYLGHSSSENFISI